jgi:RNA recognition motif-containing protein
MISCRVIRDKITRESLGYAFLQFRSKMNALHAIDAKDGMKIGSKRIKVSLARPSSESIKNCKLYVTNLPRHFKQSDVVNLFSNYGEIIHCRVLLERDTGKSRGVAFVQFARRSQAMAAIVLHGQRLTTPSGYSHGITVQFADRPMRQQDQPLRHARHDKLSDGYDSYDSIPEMQIYAPQPMYYDQNITYNRTPSDMNQMVYNGSVQSGTEIYPMQNVLQQQQIQGRIVYQPLLMDNTGRIVGTLDTPVSGYQQWQAQHHAQQQAYARQYQAVQQQLQMHATIAQQARRDGYRSCDDYDSSDSPPGDAVPSRGKRGDIRKAQLNELRRSMMEQSESVESKGLVRSGSTTSTDSSGTESTSSGEDSDYQLVYARKEDCADSPTNDFSDASDYTENENGCYSICISKLPSEITAEVLDKLLCSFGCIQSVKILQKLCAPHESETATKNLSKTWQSHCAQGVCYVSDKKQAMMIVQKLDGVRRFHGGPPLSVSLIEE